MIAEVLDRRFVLAEVARIRADLIAQLREQPTRGATRAVEHAEELADALGDALTRETAAEEAAVAAVSSGDRRIRGAETTGVLVEEHVAYMPADALISVTQSLIEEYAIDHRSGAVGGRRRPGEQLVRGATPAALPPVTSARFAMKAAPGPERVRLFERFSITDPRWAQSKLSEWLASGKHPFRDAERPEITRIAPDARLVLVGDWASGIERAQAVADFMRRAVERAASERRDVHVVHLGDTYYSGWMREYRDRLLPFWPVWPEEAAKIGSWTLNGNHDMYSGGQGYYELLEERRFARQGGLSFFHLQSDHWDLLGLDTAYKDHDLAGSQPRWVNAVRDSSGRKLMLLSHHQPFSGRSGGGTALRDALTDVLRVDRPVDAWFWGHEHRHAHYDSAELGVRHGRLLGHGGVPAWMLRGAGASHPSPETWEYRDRLPGPHLQPWAMLGFAVLDFAGPAIQIRYVNERGSTYREERIS